MCGCRGSQPLDHSHSHSHEFGELLRKFIRFIRRFLVAQVRRLLRAFFIYGSRPSGVCCALFMCSLIYLVAGVFTSGCGRTHRKNGIHRPTRRRDVTTSQVHCERSTRGADADETDRRGHRDRVRTMNDPR